MRALTWTFGCSIALCLAAGSATAQEAYYPAGTPSEGTDIQYRYDSPGDSQQILNQSGDTGGGSVDGGEGAGMGGGNPWAQALERRNAEEGAEGAEGDGGIGFSSLTYGTRGGIPIWVQQEDIYYGIIPGIQDTLPHISRYQRWAQNSSNPNALTWIGFQPLPEFDRVFIQTGRTARYTVNESPDGLTLSFTFDNTRVYLTNFWRNVDTSWFASSVYSIEAFRRGDDTEVIIELSSTTDYTVQQDGEYVFIDFN